MLMLTGEEGFLMTHLLPKIEDLNLENTLIHFAFPSDFIDFKNVDKMRKIIKDSIELFDLAMKNNYNIIFASSEAVLEKELNWYGANKLALEYYIKDYNHSLILRIPRIYGKDREKGLMRSLRNGNFEGNKNKMITYMDVDDWVQETIKIIKEWNNDKHLTYHYKDKIEDSVRDIEEKYIKF